MEEEKEENDEGEGVEGETVLMAVLVGGFLLIIGSRGERGRRFRTERDLVAGRLDPLSGKLTGRGPALRGRMRERRDGST